MVHDQITPEITAAVDRLNEQPRFFNYDLYVEEFDNGFTLTLTYAQKEDGAESDFQRLLGKTSFEGVSDRVGAAYKNFAQRLDEDMINFEHSEAHKPSELAIQITSSFFKYETFLRLLNQIEHAGVTIAHNPDDQIITFSQRLD